VGYGDRVEGCLMRLVRYVGREGGEMGRGWGMLTAAES
jgi:hypothetical protein